MMKKLGLLAGVSLLALGGVAQADTITGSWTASITGADAHLQATTGTFSVGTSGPTTFTNSNFIQIDPTSGGGSNYMATVSVNIYNLKDNSVSVPGSFTETGAYTANFNSNPQTDALVWNNAVTKSGFPAMQDGAAPKVFMTSFADGANTLDIYFVDGADWNVQTYIGAQLVDPSPTPLPATLPLFAGGLGVLGLITRRRRRKVAAVAG